MEEERQKGGVQKRRRRVDRLCCACLLNCFYVFENSGVYRHDLVYHEEAQLSRGIINFSKKKIVFGILQEISDYQKVPYPCQVQMSVNARYGSEYEMHAGEEKKRMIDRKSSVFRRREAYVCKQHRNKTTQTSS